MFVPKGQQCASFFSRIPKISVGNSCNLDEDWSVTRKRGKPSSILTG